MAKVPNVAGRYSDLSQMPIGIDVKNQLFAGLGFSGYGDGHQRYPVSRETYEQSVAQGLPYYEQIAGLEDRRFNPSWMDLNAAGVNEAGQSIPSGVLSPEAAAKLKGYTFDWQPSGKRNEGMLTAFDPEGKQVGQYWQPDTGTGQALRDYAGMLMSAAGMVFPGASTALLGKLGLGSLGSSAVMGGLGSAVRGGGLQDVLKGAALGGIGSLAAPYIGGVAKSAGEAVGGGALGEAARGAVSGAAQSGIGALASGRSLGDALLTGAVGGGMNPVAAKLVGTAGLPAPLSKAITNQLVRRAVQQTAPSASRPSPARPSAVDLRGLLTLLNSGPRRP
jgi:hypothetical protein